MIPKMSNDHKKTGLNAETVCTKYLEKQNYEIISRNYHSPYGEIDIIAKDGNYLVFIEVKYRAEKNEDFALNSVSYQKQRKLIKTALCYFAKNEQYETLFSRFDIIVIFPGADENSFEIIQYKDAFQAEDVDFE